MRSKRRGKNTSGVELVHVSEHGFWIHLLAEKRELALSFDDFPWFQDASIRALADIEFSHGHLLHWRTLDVDLDLDRVEHPGRYPLVAKPVERRKPKRAA